MLEGIYLCLVVRRPHAPDPFEGKVSHTFTQSARIQVSLPKFTPFESATADIRETAPCTNLELSACWLSGQRGCQAHSCARPGTVTDLFPLPKAIHIVEIMMEAKAKTTIYDYTVWTIEDTALARLNQPAPCKHSACLR